MECTHLLVGDSAYVVRHKIFLMKVRKQAKETTYIALDRKTISISLTVKLQALLI